MTPEEFEKSIDTVENGTPLEAAYQKITEARLLMAHMKSKSTAEKPQYSICIKPPALSQKF